MIARVPVIFATFACCGFGLSAQEDNRVFEVSLLAPHVVDLSPIYQRVVREATEVYRGDFPPGQFIFSRSYTVYYDSSGQRIESLEPSPEIVRPYDVFLPSSLQLRLQPEALSPRP